MVTLKYCPPLLECGDGNLALFLLAAVALPVGATHFQFDILVTYKDTCEDICTPLAV